MAANPNVITGTESADVLTGTVGDDLISALGGNDSVDGGGGSDVITGGLGFDTLRGGFGNDSIEGGDSDDSLFGDSGADTLRGGDGNDTLNDSTVSSTSASNDSNVLDGGLGNDSLRVESQQSANNNSLDGGASNDTMSVSGRVASSNTLSGGAGVDSLQLTAGDAQSNVLDGGADADTLSLYTTLSTSTSTYIYNSTTMMGTYVTTPSLVENNALTGGDGNDSLTLGVQQGYYGGSMMGTGPALKLTSNTLDGGLGNDYLSLSVSLAGYSVAAQGNRLIGGEGNDSIYGSLNGTLTDNTFDAGAGNDSVSLTLSGTSTNTRIDTGDGTDSVSLNLQSGTFTNTVVDTGIGADTITGSFSGSGDLSILSGEGDDQISFTFSPPYSTPMPGPTPYTPPPVSLSINAGAGNDKITLSPGMGMGSMSASNVSTAINAGDGNDTVETSGSVATITLGLGTDSLKPLSLNQTLTVTDFTPGTGGDRIDLTALAALLLNYSGNNPFGSGHMRLTQDGADTLLQIDLDASGSTNAYTTLVRLQNVTATAMVVDNFSPAWPLDGSTPPGQTLTGTESADVLTGTVGDDLISALGGNDSVDGGGGSDVITGGLGFDTLRGGFGNDSIEGGDSDDSLFGDSGADTLRGGDGNDTLNDSTVSSTSASNDSNVLDGGLGNDSLRVESQQSANNNSLDGGASNDTMSVSGRVASSNTLSGGAGVDSLQLTAGDAQSNVLDGGADADTLSLYTTLSTSTSTYIYNSTTMMGTYVTTPSLVENNALTGGDGNDSLTLGVQQGYYGGSMMGTGPALKLTSNTLDGGLGNDYLSLSVSLAGYSVAAQGNRLIGGEGNDSIYGSLNGTLTDNTFDAGAGNDSVSLTLSGTSTNTRIDTGDGTDSVSLNLQSGTFTNTVVDTGIGADTITGSFSGSGDLSILSGEGDDQISFTFSPPYSTPMPGPTPYTPPPVSLSINAGAGNDKITLSPGMGMGSMSASNVSTAINAGDGNDTVETSGSVATITLGLGTDSLKPLSLNQTLTVTDFTPGTGGDRIDLTALAALLLNYSGNNPFGSGHMRLTQDGADTLLQIDLDASGSTNAYTTLVRLQNVTATSLNSQNFYPNWPADGSIPPVIASNGGADAATITLAENLTAVTTVAATGHSVVYSIAGGADASLFTVNSSNGALSFKTAPNFESPADAGSDNQYNLIVQAASGPYGVDVQSLSIRVINANDTPVSVQALEDRTVTRACPFAFSVAPLAFADEDADAVLTYSAKLIDGNALPSWIVFSPSTRAFTGTPPDDVSGSLSIRVTATDQSGAYVSSEFSLDISTTNQAPTVQTPISALIATEDSTFAYTVDTSAIIDPDSAQTLSFSARLANGEPLPSWLTFDPVLRQFSGTPANADVGIVWIKLTATDAQSASASIDFDLTIGNVNDAPVSANLLTAQRVVKYTNFTYQIPATAFFDVDADDQLSYSVSLADGGALPSWLSFNPTTRSFTGTPGAADVGVLSIRVTATDLAGASTQSLFDLNVPPMFDITGTESADVLTGTVGDDLIRALGGNDSADGGGGSDVILGGAGFDTLRGSFGNDSIEGGDGDDSLYGDSGADTLRGGTGNDSLNDSTASSASASNNSNVLDGGTGNDSLSVESQQNANSNSLDGGEGTDTLSVGYSQFNATQSYTPPSRVASSNTLTGGAGADTLQLYGGDAQNNLLEGGADADNLSLYTTLSTYSYSYTYTTVPGSTMMTSVITNTSSLVENNTLNGGDGNDSLRLQSFGSFSGSGTILKLTFNTLDGGLGNDSLYLLSDSYNYYQSLPGLVAQGNRLLGGEGDDTISGSLNGTLTDNTFDAGSGNDSVSLSISGASTNTRIETGLGADTINGSFSGSGDLSILSGEDNDQITFAFSPSYYYPSYYPGPTPTPSTPPPVSLSINSGTGNDKITLTLGTNTGMPTTMVGSHISATINAGDGDDTVETSNSVATITLGLGTDTLKPLTANQTLTVTDFTAGTGGDRIDLSVLPGLLLNYSGNNPFGSGYMRLIQDGADTLLQVDLDAAGSTNSYTTLVRLQNVIATSLLADNFSPVWPLDGSTPPGQTITGTESADVLTGTVGDDLIRALGGNDSADGGGGSDVILGGAGFDTLRGSFGNDSIEGGDGDDSLYGDSGADTLRGGTGNDSLNDSTASSASASNNSNVLDGGTGNDSLSVESQQNANSNSLDGGEGTDTLSVGYSQFNATQSYTPPSRVASSNTLTGGAGADTLQLYGGDAQNNLLEGGADADNLSLYTTLSTYSYSYTYTTVPGSTMMTSVITNTSSLVENNTLNGGDGNDSLRLQSFGSFSGSGTILKLTFNTLDGGLGNDSLYLLSDSYNYYQSLPGLVAQGNRLLGGEGDDTISGSLNGTLTDNTFDAGSGNDSVSLSISGASTNTRIETGLGADTINGSFSGSGDLSILSGEDNDQITFAFSPSYYYPSYYPGPTPTPSTPPPVSLSINSGTGNDKITLTLGTNTGMPTTMVGSHISATINAGDGDDTVETSNSVATITLGLGTDTLKPLTANQTLTVTDFTAGTGGDRIDLSVLPGLLLNYSGNNPFGSGYMRLIQDGADTLLQVDLDAAGSTNSYTTLVRLQNVIATSLLADNFSPVWPLDGSTPPGQTITGTESADVLTGTVGDDLIRALGGNDSADGGGGSDVILGGAGFDTLRGSFGNDSIEGGDGDDSLYGDSGADTLRGGTGNDSLNDSTASSASASNNSNVLDGGTGNDSLSVESQQNANSNSLDGGEGTDTLSVGYSQFNATQSYTPPSRVASSNTLTGGAGADTLQLYGGDAQNNLLEGGADADNLSLYTTLSTYSYSYTYTTVPGSTMMTSVITNTSSLVENNTLNGGDGNDSLRLQSFGSFSGSGTILKLTFNTLDGGLGNDSLYLLSDSYNYYQSLPGLVAQGNRLLGGEGDDTISGSLNGTLTDNTFDAGSGNDSVSLSISGASTNTRIETGLGADTINGSFSGSGDLSILSGEDNDQITFAFSPSYYYPSYYPGPTPTPSTPPPVSLSINSGTGNDKITLTLGTNTGMPTTMVGSHISATINAGDGDDTVETSNSVATITLGLGTDTLKPLTANQTLTVTDFTAGTGGDRIDLSVLPGLLLNYSGNNPFGSGYMRLIQDGADTLLQVDLDAAGSTNSYTTLIRLQNVTATNLTSENLIPGWAPLGGIAPTIVSNGGGDSANVSVNENSSAVTTVVATDPDLAQQPAYAIIGGADAARFSIDAQSGALAFIASPDYERPLDANLDNVYEVTVGAQDINRGVDAQRINVTVINQADAPTLLRAVNDQSANILREFLFNLPGNTFVNTGETLSYEATLGDGSPLPTWLTINPSTGAFSGTPSESDFGALTIRLTARNSLNQTTSDVFELTVGGYNEAPSGEVTISGTAAQEQILSAANTIVDADGLGSISYQWKSNGIDIFGAINSTYRLTQAEVGKNITATASYVDAGGRLESVTSSATDLIVNVNDAPTGAVTINGISQRGQTLTASVSTLADADGLGPISYQWRANNVDIPGATAQSYVLRSADIGKTITVQARYTDGFGTAETVTSAETSPVASTVGITLNGTPGVDTLVGGVLDDTLNGFAGNDLLVGGSGDDLLSGGLGSDRFIGGAGSDTIDGGEQRNVRWSFGLPSDYDVLDYSTTAGTLIDLSARTVQVTGGAGVDSYNNIEEIWGATNATDTITGLTSANATETAIGGGAIYLYLKGGSDTVDITPYGYQPWADGAQVGYHWTQTAINVAAVGDTTTVTYGAAGSQLAGVDTLKHVGFIGDTRYNDVFDMSLLTENQYGYKTDPYEGKSWNLLLLGRGGSDSVVGNGQTILAFGGVTSSSNGLGLNIDLSQSTADLSRLSSNGAALGTLTYSGIYGLMGTNFNDTLIGGGNDAYELFRGQGGDDFIDGGTGYDRADYLGSSEGIVANLTAGTVSSASQGNDTLRSIEEVRGSRFDDVFDARGFTGGTLSTSENVGSFWYAFNAFFDSGGNDTIYGNGATRIDYSYAMVGVRVDLASGIADSRLDADKLTPQYLTLGRDVFSGVYSVRGTVLDDELLGGGAGRITTGVHIETFRGGAGNDTIDGQGGYDEALYDSSPNAIVVDMSLSSGQVSDDGWGFSDTLSNVEGIVGTAFADVVTGGSDSTAFFSFSGGGGADTFYGGAGTNQVVYSGDPTGVVVRLDGWVGASGALPIGFDGSALDGRGNIDVFTDVVEVEGSNYDDRIFGNARDNVLDGRGGNDTIDGGAGVDTVEYNQAMQAVYVDLSQGRALNDGQGIGDAPQDAAIEQDVLISIENVVGGQGNDSIVGDASANRLEGGNGNDTITGGAGNDTLIGGDGTDSLSGGQGDDLFVVDDNDTLTDFGAGDVIRVEGLSFTNSLASGNGDSVLKGGIEVYNSGSTTRLYLGVDDNPGADRSITLQGSYQVSQFAASGSDISYVKQAASGSVTISGQAVQGQTLMVSNDLSDLDSMGPVTYQWRADGVDIGGANSSSLVLGQAQVGKLITVAASYTDGFGFAESVSSAATAEVANVDEAPTGSVIISGTAIQGQTLDAAHTLADIDGLGTITYQWKADGVNIAGATGSSLVLAQEQVGKAITVVASYTDQQGTHESVGSDATSAVENVNDAPTGSVSISGTAAQGQTLLAESALADLDGLGTIAYQWKADGVNVAGATGPSLVLAQAQVGKAITVAASYTDGFGFAESVSSAATSAVANVNDTPTGSVTISGVAAQDQTLLADNALVDVDGLGPVTYQWRADGVNISGANSSSLVLGQAQVGKLITVAASYTDGFGFAESVSSAATSAVANVNDTANGSVTISGSAIQGQTLDAAHTLADIDGLGTITYQWKADGLTIDGASGSSLVLGQAQVGKLITVLASYTDQQGTPESVGSDATSAVANVNDAPTGSVSISGAAAQGQTLLAQNTLADVDGLGTITYQWKVNGTNIFGATASTFTLTQAEVGKTITVAASYTDLMGTAESVTSAGTSAVANVNDAPTGSVTITGTAQQGQTLTAANTLADIDGLGVITYQWRANGIDISGATAQTYVLTAAEVGKTVTVLARYTDGFGTAESASSAATSAITSTVGVTLTGTAAANTLTGTALDDTLNGLAGNDTLNGAAGNDTLDGGAGTDSMVGGAGDDTYVVDVTTDVIVEAVNSGTDTVRTALASYTLGTTNGSANVENLVYTGTAAFTGTGNALANAITGGAGNDTLDGGAGNDTLTGGAGNDTYTVDAAGDVVVELAGGGTDTVRTALSSYTLGAEIENLVYTGAVSFTGNGNGLNNSITGGAAADVLNGSDGNDTLLGSGGNDTLSGAAGDDSLDGGAGNDSMVGGAGNDTYVVDAATDIVVEVAGEGTDLIRTALASFSLNTAALANIENLTYIGTLAFTGTGNALANVITGGAGVDTLNGNDGDDTLIGAAANDTLNGGNGNDSLDGAAGNDSMVGGAGDDTYVVDVTTDVIVEAASSGTDTVRTALASYTLGTTNGSANVENLVYTGTAAFTGTGNALANAITGGAGNDTLDGGTGNDTLTAGAGDDTYTVDAVGDVVVELAGGGTDTVRTALSSYTLGAEIENLVYTGAASFTGNGNILNNSITGGAAADVLNGSDGNDTLLGSGGNDTLNGAAGDDSLDGGTGNDSMVGGAGNDTYVVDASTDVIVEALNEGTDLVRTALASFSLTTIANVENLTYTGTLAFTGSGNALANVITGAAGTDNLTGNDGDDSLSGAAANDTLNGGNGNDTLDGGAGNDSMVGGAGDDTYVVDVTTDVIVEGASSGTDTVRTALASYTLGTTNGSANVENLVYTGTVAFTGTGSTGMNAIAGGTGADTLNGLAGNDTLDGGAGNDTLNGGVGADVLIGGAGADRFAFSVFTDTGTTASLRDIINDFVVASDRIDISAIDANTGVANDQAFTWRGTAGINGVGQLAMAYDGVTNTTVISGNIDANLAADFTIALLGNYSTTLSATDFVL